MSRPITAEELKRLCPGASASTLRRNAAIQLGKAAAKKRLRQSAKGPNKWEREFASLLRECGFRVWEKPVKFKLGNGVTYEPDIMSFGNPDAFALTLYEVKGFMRDDAAVKLKVAASLYPCFHWYLVWKDKGEWRQQRIIP